MRKTTLITFLFFFGICLGQHSKTETCSLKPDNKSWLFEFKDSDDISDQTALVVNKILSDTDYFEENPEIENPDDRRVFGSTPCTKKCSIRFVLVYGKSKGLVLDVHKNPELEELIEEFSSENISKIEVNQYNERDIYKPRAVQRSGVVLYTDDKALKKKIRKTIKAMSKS